MILITGATGYVGGRLISLVEKMPGRLRCAVRNPDIMNGRVAETTQVVRFDVLDLASVRPALKDVHTAFYLIHSMGSASDFQENDRIGASNFATAAREQGLKRIVYLGGLGDSNESLSDHLSSRHEVGDILRTSGAEVIEFRASIIIGSGSLSFELVRALVGKLPVMIWPKWVSTKASPIAVEDVLSYMTAILNKPLGGSRIYEIGSAPPVSYGEIMKEYARQRNVTRFTVRVPWLSPRLSSLWLGLVTPVYARIGAKLILSLENPTVVTDTSALSDFEIVPRSLSESISRALSNEDHEFAETRWSDALSSSGPLKGWGGMRFGNRLVDSRVQSVPVSAEQAFRPILNIGGKRGWYYANWLWRIRGFIDTLAGGVGLRRGRKSPNTLMVGDTLDFWRVEKFEDNHILRLHAEMKLPGRAWLEFEVNPINESESEIRQTAEFDPAGLFGRLYWFGIWPLHQLVFGGMLRSIAKHAKSTN